MKDKLVAIFNALRMVETKGESTLILADSMREFAKLINELPDEDDKKAEPEA